MKYLPVILLAFIATVFATSCKKKYLCECREDQYTQHQYVNQKAYADNVKARNRDEAERQCINRQSEEIDENGNGHKTICSLK